MGSQICRSAAALTAFIDWVAAEAGGFDGITEIVINGDMVDFLAPAAGSTPTEWIADQGEVIRRLDRIIAGSRDKTSGRGPFEALADFLRADRSAATLLLGNHDIELSLPLVRQHLEALLGPKLRFIYDGEPLVRGRVLIEHGNRYDAWNSIDHSRLRQERSHLARGLSINEKERDKKFFRAPAGTYLVVHGINTVLPKYPFINLLKPENEAAVPLLLAIEPELRKVITQALSLAPPVVSRLQQGKLTDAVTPVEAGRMSGSGAIPTKIQTVDDALAAAGVAPALFPAPVAVAPMGGAAILDRTHALWESSRQIAASITALLNPVALAEQAVDAMMFRRMEASFKALQGQRTFDLGVECPCYLDAAKAMVASGLFDVVVFGHTHLPKRIEIARAGNQPAVYLNTGTWADVMKLPDLVCESSAAGNTARRDFLVEVAAHRIQPYLATSLGYAEIELEGDHPVNSELRSFLETNPRSPAQSRFR